MTNATQIAALEFNANVDDGFVAWINGREVRRVNVTGNTDDPVTINTLAGGATEPVPFVVYNLGAVTNLINGTNVIAIQVFNTTLNSSDLDFDCALNALLIDTNRPVIVSITPPPGSTLASLTQITVQFSEVLTGLSADDMNVHGIGASALSGTGPTYTFTFPPAPYGNVPITWVSGHGITDLATPPNGFDETQPGHTWTYTLVDNVPPTVANLFPPAGATVQALGQIEVTFSEPVNGVDAADLLVNGQPATNVVSQPGAVYLFQFPQQPNGAVSVAWAANHGIVDTATTPQAFGGGSWGYMVDSTANANGIIINEISASNENGLLDEDGDAEDWIEIYNGGTNSVNLSGWSLTDDLDEPGRWVFPSRLLNAGQYLVVFASAKDRRAPTGTNRFHTNFKLSGDGEFLGLFTPDSPRQLASGFSPKFPLQRIDYSYGREAGGSFRYFGTGTPGATNGTSTIVGVVEPVHFSTSRGIFTQPFSLVLNTPTRGASIRYTTNGTDPTAVNGFSYTGSLTISGTFFIRAAAFQTNKLSSTIGSHSYFFNQSAAIRSLPIISIQTASNNMTGPTGITGMSGGTGPPANPWTATGPNDYYNPTKSVADYENIVLTLLGASWAPAVSFGLLLLVLGVRPQGLFGR